MATNKYQFVKKDDIVDQKIDELNADNEYLAHINAGKKDVQVTVKQRSVPLVSFAQVRALRRPQP